MYCPNCKQEYDGWFCPECGTPLQERTVTSGGTTLNLGDANAIMGGVHVSDSHNIHNDDHSVHNTTIVEATKTHEQLTQENETMFLKSVQQCLADGKLEAYEQAALMQQALIHHISADRAAYLIEQMRRSATVLQGASDNEFLAQQTLREIINAVSYCQTEVLQRRLQTLKHLADSSPDANVQFYYHMLRTSFTPEVSTMELLNTNIDNYWQLFWNYVAGVKLGHSDRASGLLPRLGGFGAPRGDMALLMAIDNLAAYRKCNQEYYKEQAKQNLMQATHAVLSELLSAMWYAIQELLKSDQNPEIWCKFYVEQTLKEFLPVKAPPLPTMNPLMGGMGMPGAPQGAGLPQMQGFNPVQAAQQMGLGQMPSMQQVQSQMPTATGFSGVPPMSQGMQPMQFTTTMNQGMMPPPLPPLPTNE